VREAGRNTQGVRIIRVGAGEQVVDVEPVADKDDGEEPQHLAPIMDSLVPPEPTADTTTDPKSEN
jgi:DNA gyrase/topoisomerase IV subunit A